MKDWLVVFNEDGSIDNTKELTNPSVPPRKRRISIRATTAGGAEKAAKILYTFAE